MCSNATATQWLAKYFIYLQDELKRCNYCNRNASRNMTHSLIIIHSMNNENKIKLISLQSLQNYCNVIDCTYVTLTIDDFANPWYISIMAVLIIDNYQIVILWRIDVYILVRGLYHNINFLHLFTIILF